MTFEQSCRTWTSGFIGWKDNSEEAKQRRRKERVQQQEERTLRKMGFIASVGGVIVTVPGSELSKILEDKPWMSKLIR